MIFKTVQVASFIGFVKTPWKRVSAANACVSDAQEMQNYSAKKSYVRSKSILIAN
jgi:hypothetical protein